MIRVGGEGVQGNGELASDTCGYIWLLIAGRRAGTERCRGGRNCESCIRALRQDRWQIEDKN